MNDETSHHDILKLFTFVKDENEWHIGTHVSGLQDRKTKDNFFIIL